MSIRVSSGIKQLDHILHSGFITHQSYLLRGGPGMGKTTLGLHFLEEGVKENEKCLFITFGEQSDQIKRNAQNLGINIENIDFLDLSPDSNSFSELESYDIFSAAEVELDPITQKIVDKVDQINPDRVFVDAITQFRYLTQDGFQFHKQILGFLRYIRDQDATILFTSENTTQLPDDDLQFLSDGIVNLLKKNNENYLQVTKFRGSGYEKGLHNYQIHDDGFKLYPILIPEKHNRDFMTDVISFGIPAMNEMLHGGLNRGTVTFITGPSGIGKTTLGIQFIKEAAGRGERSVVYLFEEDKMTLMERCSSIRIPVKEMVKNKHLYIEQIEPLKFSVNEFAQQVKQEVEENDTKIIMLDSISGYELMIRGQDMQRQIYSLCRYLKNMGVTVLLINEVESMMGHFKLTEQGTSFLADNLIFMRYLEVQSRIAKAIGVLKKRISNFEKSLRKFEITDYGIKIGDPLDQLSGILTGNPEFKGHHQNENFYDE